MILSVDDLRFSYNSHPVLQDVSFGVAPGRILALLGVNGAGKSTLLKCIDRLVRPSGGAIRVEGRDLQSFSRAQVSRRIGYVPQRSPDAQLTVFEAVLLGRKPYLQWSYSDDDYGRAEGIIRQMGLADLAGRPVSGLSGGEAQKVVIARALAQSPRVLLLDEPTSNLDLKNQMEVMALIGDIVRQGRLAAVVALHDLNLAVRFADDFLLLKDHRVFAAAGPGELTADMVRAVYGIEVVIGELAGHPVVVPVQNGRAVR